MGSAKQFFEEYVRDRRGQDIEHYTREDLGHLVRYSTQTSADDFATFSRLQPSEATSFRGRGIYKALYEERLAEAARRGYERITVDASPMSRPILEKIGFFHICSTTPMRYKIA